MDKLQLEGGLHKGLKVGTSIVIITFSIKNIIDMIIHCDSKFVCECNTRFEHPLCGKLM